MEGELAALSKVRGGGNGLTLGIGGVHAGTGYPEVRGGPLCEGVMGAVVACGRRVREKDQKGRCEEEEQVGGHQCPQDVVAALHTAGPNAWRVPAGGEGGR